MKVNLNESHLMKIYLLPDAFSDHNSLLGHNLIFLLREFLAWCMPADRVLDPESYLNQKCITKCNQHYLVEFSEGDILSLDI